MTAPDDAYEVAIDPRWDTELHRHLHDWAAHVRDQTIASLEAIPEPTNEDREVLGLLRLLGTENVTPQAFGVWHGLCLGLAADGNACAIAAVAQAQHLARKEGMTLPGLGDDGQVVGP